MDRKRHELLLQYGFGLALITGFALYRRYRDAELYMEALERQSNADRPPRCECSFHRTRCSTC